MCELHLALAISDVEDLFNDLPDFGEDMDRVGIG